MVIYSLSKSFYNVLEDLKIDRAYVIVPGDRGEYHLDNKTQVWGFAPFLTEVLDHELWS